MDPSGSGELTVADQANAVHVIDFQALQQQLSALHLEMQPAERQSWIPGNPSFHDSGLAGSPREACFAGLPIQRQFLIRTLEGPKVTLLPQANGDRLGLRGGPRQSDGVLP